MEEERSMLESKKSEDVVRKVEGHDVAIAMWSRDPDLGVTVCG